MITDYTGPNPHLALAVARMMVQVAGWTETWTGPTYVEFRKPDGTECAVYLDATLCGRVPDFRPDLDRNQPWEVEEALTRKEQRNEYLDLIRSYLMDDGLATGDVWWDFRHAPTWLCCVAALEAVK